MAYYKILSTIALMMGVSWASGVNLYAAVLVMGLLGKTGYMILPPGLQILEHPLIICAAAFMYLIEFILDKIPGIDTGWHTLQTFICIPAGAVLAAGVVGKVDPIVSVAAGIIGGGIATGTHLTKTGTRAMLNVSPEPFTNVTASIGKDIAVIAGLWAAFHNPLLFIILLIIFFLLMIYLLPKIIRQIKKIIQAIARLFGYTGHSHEPTVHPKSKRDQWP